VGLTKIRAAQISNIDYKQSCRVLTATNITLSGGAPAEVDGISLVTNDRVLVIGQTNKTQNGLYRVDILGTGSNGTWVRTGDTDTAGELEAGAIVMVTEGTVYKDTQWKLITNDPIIIGSSELIFELNSAFAFGNIYANGTAVLANTVGDAVTFTAGNNISITGNAQSQTVTFDVIGISLNSISNGTSNVNVVSSGGNVTVGIDGVNNVVVFGSSQTTFAGNVIPAANVTYDLGSGSALWRDLYLSGNTIFLGQANIKSQGTTVIIENDLGTGEILATGNVSGANINTAGQVIATGNVSGANINTAGQVIATGNVSGGNLSGTNITGTLETASQPNVTSVGTLTSLSVTGNVEAGNLSGTNITGTLSTASQPNVTSLGTLTSLDVTGNITSGNVSGTNITGTLATAAQPNVTSLGTLTSLSVTGNISAGNVSGTLLTGTLETAAQPNVTSLGTLTSLSVTGNISAGNISVSGLETTSGIVVTGDATITGNLTVQGTEFIANVTSLQVSDPLIGLGRGPNNTPLVSNDGLDRGLELWYYTDQERMAFVGYDNANALMTMAAVATVANNVITVSNWGTTKLGNIIATGNITAPGNVSGGNLTTASVVIGDGPISGVTTISASGNANVGNIGAVNVVATNIAGTLDTAAQPNITSVGTLTSLSVTGNVSAGNVSGTIGTFANIAGTLDTAAQPNITSLGTLTSLDVTGNITGGNLSGTNVTGTLTTASQPNITSLGTLTSLSVTGNVSAGNLTTTGQVVATGNITGDFINGKGTALTGINAFGNIAVDGETTVSADNTSDTLTFVAGSGISIVTDAANNSITFQELASDSIFLTGGDMGLITDAVTISEDLGLITDAFTVEYLLGTIVTSGIIQPDSLILPSKTVAELANISANPAGQFVYCSDDSGGSVPAFSDGTNWRRVTDRNIVS
jgi:hypothetical protein